MHAGTSTRLLRAQLCGFPAMTQASYPQDAVAVPKSTFALAGMDTLLDHLERGNEALQPLVLSVVADLLQQSRLAHACFSDWLSERSQRGGVQLLLHLWREAETDWQVCADGVLTNTKKPLAGTGKRSLWMPKREVRRSSACAPRRPLLRREVLQLTCAPCAGAIRLSVPTAPR